MDFWRFDRTGLDASTLIIGDYDLRLVFLRDEDGAWTSLEAYIGRRSKAQFTHGIWGQCEGEM